MAATVVRGALLCDVGAAVTETGASWVREGDRRTRFAAEHVARGTQVRLGTARAAHAAMADIPRRLDLWRQRGADLLTSSIK